jgi:hypothetical protein
VRVGQVSNPEIPSNPSESPPAIQQDGRDYIASDQTTDTLTSARKESQRALLKHGDQIEIDGVGSDGEAFVSDDVSRRDEADI